MPKVSNDAPKPTKKKTGGGVWDRVVSVKEYASGQGMKIGIFGRSGTGKSTAVLSFPRKTLYIVPSTTGEVKAFKKEENVDVVGIEQANELLELINDTAQMKKYATVSLDHCTEFQGLVMKQVLNIEEVPEQLSWGLATMEQWQEIAGVLKEYLTKFLALPLNVCVLAQERENNFEKASDIIIPNVTYGLLPAVNQWLGPKLDNTVHMFIKEGVVAVKKKKGDKEIVVNVEKMMWCMRTGPHPVYYTKLRVPKGTAVPPYIVIGENDSPYKKLVELGVT